MMTLIGDAACIAMIAAVLMGVGYIGYEMGTTAGRQRGYQMARGEEDCDRAKPVGEVAVGERVSAEAPR